MLLSYLWQQLANSVCVPLLSALLLLSSTPLPGWADAQPDVQTILGKVAEVYRNDHCYRTRVVIRTEVDGSDVPGPPNRISVFKAEKHTCIGLDTPTLCTDDRTVWTIPPGRKDISEADPGQVMSVVRNRRVWYHDRFGALSATTHFPKSQVKKLRTKSGVRECLVVRLGSPEARTGTEELWIDSETYRVLQSRVSEPLRAGAGFQTTTVAWESFESGCAQ